MRITMLVSAATRTGSFQAGHTYDVDDAVGAEMKRAGHARDPEGIEDPDIVITRKPGRTRRMDTPAPSVTADAPKPGLTADAPPPGVVAAATVAAAVAGQPVAPKK